MGEPTPPSDVLLAVLPGKPQASGNSSYGKKKPALNRDDSFLSSSSSSNSAFSDVDSKDKKTPLGSIRPELQGAMNEEAQKRSSVTFGRRNSQQESIRGSLSSTSQRRANGQPSLKEFNENRRRQSFTLVQQKAAEEVAVKRASLAEEQKEKPPNADERIAKQQMRKSMESESLKSGRRPSMAVGVVRSNGRASTVAIVPPAGGDEQKAPMCFCLTEIRVKSVPYCRFIHRNRWFQSSMILALVAALFLPDVWVLADRPTNDDLDVILTLVLLMFIVEFAVQCIALSRTYIGSFFFYMDILGALSLLLDLSYVGILGGQEGGNSNVVIMRAARIAKLGARAGRFTKLVKLLRFLPGMQGYGNDAGTAKAINARLIQGLSIRVSCLIITMVMITPLFSLWTFPESDESMMSWIQRLDDMSLSRPDVLARELQKLEDFFKSLDYYPHKITAKPSSGLPIKSLELLPWESQRGQPVRADSVQTRESSSLICEFNFSAPNQMDAAMNLLMLIFVMVLMIGFSMVLQNATSKIVLRPLEMLLAQVRQTAATIFQSVNDMHDKDGEAAQEPEEDENAEASTHVFFGAEKALLDKVVEKISLIQQQQEEVDDSGGWTGTRNNKQKDEEGSPPSSPSSKTARQKGAVNEDEDWDEVLKAQSRMLDESGLSLDLLDSWHMNPLEMDKARNKAAVVYIVGPQNHGIRCELQATAFMDSVEANHNKSNPYHSWFHAVDVAHAVWRFTQSCQVQEYLSDVERFGLLVSAVCHDIGHPGLNNAFLMETRHEFAMTYNDRSPLENMSAALLFRLLAAPGCNIFAPLPPAKYSEARKVVIDAILHTDNTQHFAMVKEVQMFYEMNSEILDASRDIFHDMTAEEDDNFPTMEALEVYKEPANKRLLVNLLLHTADISNSTKPFRICRTWAYKVMDEFFQQGDKEKELGLEVQALNDRNKVNRSFSQMGFIEFLVAPLLLTAIKALPPFEPLLEQMVLNMKSWQSQWLSETQPPPSDADKKMVQDRVQKLQARYNDSQIST
mmetsp:Transcript_44586/g.80160  ORF Transcript_44586/g.80160 Transcript_44586/m.80160 type:complete len:1024 (-) Transcript_44586:39-3110(-)